MFHISVVFMLTVILPHSVVGDYILGRTPSSVPEVQSFSTSLPSPPDDDSRSFEFPFLEVNGRIRLALVAGVIGVAVTVLIFFLGLVCYSCINALRTRKVDIQPHELDLVAMSDRLKFSYKQLSAATGQFREGAKLGHGVFDCVYRGVLPSTGQRIAVKKVGVGSIAKQAVGKFLAEVSIVSELRHRNIVRLLGWSSDSGKLLMVYELKANGSLDKILFETGPYAGTGLSWDYRFRIILGIASALQHLHEGFRQQVIHRSIKSSNIMLDDEFNAMLGDFGLPLTVLRSNEAAATCGYLAPELSGTHKFSAKTDVYAFGAVALEVVCGRKAHDPGLPDDETLLTAWVWNRLNEQNLLSVVDNKLDGEYDSRQVQEVLMLGLLCSHPEPDIRPSMRIVLEILAGSTPLPPVTKLKPTFRYNKM